MRIREVHLPDWVNEFRYVKNHHYIVLVDKEGNEHKFEAKSMIRGICQSCRGVVYVEANLGSMMCPHCGSNAQWTWGQATLQFIKEEEGAFASFKKEELPPGPPVADPDDVT